MAALVDVYKTLEIYGDHGNIKKECVYTYTHTHTHKYETESLWCTAEMTITF